MDVTNRITTVVGVTGVTNSIGQIRQLQSTITNLKAELEQFGITGKSVVELTAGIALLTAGFKLMGMAIKDARSELQATRRLKFALGSADAANKAVGEGGALSVKYGIDDSVINSTFASMANFGVKADELSKSFEAIADLASLGGSRTNAEDVFNKLRRALATGQITGIAMRGLVGEGVPIQQILAEYMAKTQGGSEKDWQKKLGKSGFTVPGGMDPMQFIVEAMKTSKYKGQALEEANGTFGSIDRIRASIAEIFEDTGKLILRVLKPLTQALATLFEWFVKINEALGGGLGFIVIAGLMTAGIWLTTRAILRCTIFLNAFKLTLDRIAASAGMATAGNAVSGATARGGIMASVTGLFRGGRIMTMLGPLLARLAPLLSNPYVLAGAVIAAMLGGLVSLMTPMGRKLATGLYDRLMKMLMELPAKINAFVAQIPAVMNRWVGNLMSNSAKISGLFVQLFTETLPKLFMAFQQLMPLIAITLVYGLIRVLVEFFKQLPMMLMKIATVSSFPNSALGKKYAAELGMNGASAVPATTVVANNIQKIADNTQKMAEGVLWGNQGWRGQAYLGSWQARAAHGRALAPTGAAG